VTAVSPDSWGRRSRLVAWWAHHEWLWGFNALGIAATIFVSDIFLPHLPLAGVITLMMVLLFVPGYVMQSLATSSHFTYICVECMQQVPEDAGIRAQRHLGRLRIHHVLKGKWTAFISFAMVLVLIITSSVFLLQTAILVLMYLVMAVENFLSAFHRPLVMYCPWCKWDGGGKHEHAPTPNPTMIKTS
jgi:hypothetical protein